MACFPAHRGPEHLHPGAAPCGVCGGGARVRGPSGDGYGAVVLARLLEERWPELSPEERLARFAAELWDPSRARDLPKYVGLGERLRPEGET